jgi:hypothetical protein
MKVGNKVLCKKGFFIYYDCCEFKSGEYYSIVNISDTYIIVKNRFGGLDTFIFEQSNYLSQNIKFFYDYFYTEKEIRKMKLNKLILNQN